MGEPVRLYIMSEIILDEGTLPPGVLLDDVAKKVHEHIWGGVVPTLGLKADKDRGKASKAHVHESTYDRSCPNCMYHAQDEENSDNA